MTLEEMQRRCLEETDATLKRFLTPDDAWLPWWPYSIDKLGGISDFHRGRTTDQQKEESVDKMGWGYEIAPKVQRKVSTRSTWNNLKWTRPSKKILLLSVKVDELVDVSNYLLERDKRKDRENESLQGRILKLEMEIGELKKRRKK